MCFTYYFLLNSGVTGTAGLRFCHFCQASTKSAFSVTEILCLHLLNSVKLRAIPRLPRLEGVGRWKHWYRPSINRNDLECSQIYSESCSCWSWMHWNPFDALLTFFWHILTHGNWLSPGHHNLSIWTTNVHRYRSQHHLEHKTRKLPKEGCLTRKACQNCSIGILCFQTFSLFGKSIV